ncbi:MAG: efflux RND transporter periplasmic adaptor subunit [Steroidobacter sp.]
MKNSARQPAAQFDETEAGESTKHGQIASEETTGGTPPVARIADFPTRSPDGHVPSKDAPVETAPEDREAKPMWKWIAVAALIIAGVVAWMVLREPAAPAALADPTAAPLELAAVDLATVEPRVLTRLLPLSGSISPFVQATVKSKVGGEVEQVTVREGQDVKAGEVIARIDTRNLQAQYDRELAAVEKARADLELAKLNRDKNRTLLEQKYISQNTYESTESAFAASLASFKLAEAQARLMQINLEDAVIRAPFAGTIARRLVHPGEVVSADSSIVSLVDLRQMVLEAAVPAADIPSVRIGQTAQFKVGGFGARKFEGEVQRINPTTADGSRAITIYIAVANADSALKGGMFAQGELTLDATQPVLAVPQRAVRDEAGVAYVFTLHDGKVVRTPVTLGAPVEGAAFVEVREGLSAGERVIVAAIDEDKAGASAFVRGEPQPSAATRSAVN